MLWHLCGWSKERAFSVRVEIVSLFVRYVDRGVSACILDVCHPDLGTLLDRLFLDLEMLLQRRQCQLV